VATSVYSRSLSRTQEDSFFLKLIQSPCVDNKLAFDPPGSFVYANHYGSDPVSDVTYQIGDADVVIDPKYSTSMDTDDCPLIASLLVLDEATNLWNDVSVSLMSWISLF